MPFSIIAAHERNRGIGLKGNIPWYIKKDFQWFKEQTKGKIVLMGLTTYFSLPNRFRPLPDRENLVLCDIPDKIKTIEDEGGAVFSSIKQATEYCKDKDCFIIGGASVYSQFIGIADKLFLTEINYDFTCDTFFPYFNKDEWDRTFKSEMLIDETLLLPYTFNIYERKKNS
jgi:dihydrofolate reductase